MKRLTLWTYRIVLMALNIGAVLANIYQEKYSVANAITDLGNYRGNTMDNIP